MSLTVLLPIDFKNLDSKVRMLDLSSRSATYLVRTWASYLVPYTCHFPHFNMGESRRRVLGVYLQLTLGSIPGSGRSPGEGNGNPLQYSCLENPHGQRSLAGYSLGLQRVRHDWRLSTAHG